jgi:hypothetical protein
VGTSTCRHFFAAAGVRLPRSHLIVTLPPDVGKCLSSLRQTGYRCPHTIPNHQTCLVASTPFGPSCYARVHKPRTPTTCAFRSPAAFRVRACPFGRFERASIPSDHRHHHYFVRRSLAKRTLLPSRPATHATLRYAPRLRRIPPRRPAVVLRVEHRDRLAPRRDPRR